MRVVLLFHFVLVTVMLSACGNVSNQAQLEEFLAKSAENNSTKNEGNSTKQESESNLSSSNIVITTTTKTDENSSDTNNSNKTNNSSSEQNSTEGSLTDLDNNPIINDPNNTGSPDDNGSSVPPVDDTNASTDTNTTISTDDTNSSSDMNSTNGIVITNPVLDSVDAVVDVNACQVGESFASSIRDFSDNNDAQVSDTVNGVAIQSLYTETGNVDNSTVIALYPKLSETSKLNMSLDNVNVYGDNAQFVLSFNEVWFKEPKATFYVITPKKNSGLFACFRLIVKKDENSTLSFQKVYR